MLSPLSKSDTCDEGSTRQKEGSKATRQVVIPSWHHTTRKKIVILVMFFFFFFLWGRGVGQSLFFWRVLGSGEWRTLKIPPVNSGIESLSTGKTIHNLENYLRISFYLYFFYARAKT